MLRRAIKSVFRTDYDRRIKNSMFHASLDHKAVARSLEWVTRTESSVEAKPHMLLTDIEHSL